MSAILLPKFFLSVFWCSWSRSCDLRSKFNQFLLVPRCISGTISWRSDV